MEVPCTSHPEALETQMRKEEGPAAPTDSTSSYVMVGAAVYHHQNSWRWHRRSATPLQLLETLVILFDGLIEISCYSHRHAYWIQLSTDLSTPIGSVGHDARSCVKYGRESPSVGSRVTKNCWLRRMCRFVGPGRLCRERYRVARAELNMSRYSNSAQYLV